MARLLASGYLSSQNMCTQRTVILVSQQERRLLCTTSPQITAATTIVSHKYQQLDSAVLLYFYAEIELNV